MKAAQQEVGGGGRCASEEQLRELYLGIRAASKATPDEAELWKLAWERALDDAAGRTGFGLNHWSRAKIRREALEWLENGEAVEFLMFLGFDYEKSQARVDQELIDLGRPPKEQNGGSKAELRRELEETLRELDELRPTRYRIERRYQELLSRVKRLEDALRGGDGRGED